jgi:hypothetical protein
MNLAAFWSAKSGIYQFLTLALGNYALVAGTTGTGKTVTLQVRAREPRFSPPISKAISLGSRCPETRSLTCVSSSGGRFHWVPTRIRVQ